MATFDYTHKGWDKARPTLLPSTGLGKVLKTYEAERVRCGNKGANWAEAFADAYKALDDVEKARLEALKLCKEKKHTKAAEYLASADPKGERSLLAAPIGNRLVNLYGTLNDEMTDLENRYDERIKNLKEAIESFKNNQISRGAKLGEKLVLDDGNLGVPKFKDQDQFNEALNPKYGLKREPGLVQILTKLQSWRERLKQIGEKRKESEELLRTLRPLVQGAQKKMLEGKDPNVFF